LTIAHSPDSVHYPELVSRLPSMEGETVAITGTTSGTGKAAARALAHLGAKLLLLNRSSSRSKASFDALRAEYPEAELHAVECDLQSFASVRAAAEKVRALCPEGVHVLCNNAGVMALPDQATGDGFDVQMQTNHLSHFLLTRELMPRLERAAEASGEARVVNHSSSARLVPKKTLLPEYLERRGGRLGGDGNALLNLLFMGPRWLRYNQSKLANCAFTAALHHRLQAKGSKVKALLAHPGLARTELQQTTVKEGGMGRIFTDLFMRLGQSAEDGALGILSCMCLPEAESGQFYGPGLGVLALEGPAKAYGLESFYDDEATRERLWTKSEEAIGEPFPL
jgi:NAD(P)-dependent dehydrogenase (short-subunit alcohol dehydrogenase family)